jgi:hypothetical protein
VLIDSLESESAARMAWGERSIRPRRPPHPLRLPVEVPRLVVRRGHKHAIAHKILRTLFFMLLRREYFRVSDEALSVQRKAPRWIKALTQFRETLITQRSVIQETPGKSSSLLGLRDVAIHATVWIATSQRSSQ